MHTIKSGRHEAHSLRHLRGGLFGFARVIFGFLVILYLISIVAPKPAYAWWNNGYGWRKNITFNNSAQAENLANFPVLVKLTSTNFDFSKTQSSGQDIRFLDADDSTELSYEIERWDATNQVAEIWVKVPQVDASSTTDSIYMYYGNPSAIDSQAATSVWDSNFKMVQHLVQQTGAYLDSTSNAVNSSTQTIGNRNATGLAGVGGQFTANTQNIKWTNPTPLKIANNYTVSIAFKAAATDGDGGWLINRGWWIYNNYLISINTDGTIYIEYYSDTEGYVNATTTASFLDNQWHWVDLVKSSTAGFSVYVDNVLRASNSKTSDAVTGGGGGNFDNLYINAPTPPTDAVFDNGIIDEVRISNTIRSSSWIAAQYKSMNDTFNTLGNETDNPVAKTFTISNSVTAGASGKQRLSGRVTTGDSSFTISSVDYSVNGGGWSGATATDGSFNSTAEDFYFDFLSSDNNYSGDGFTARVRARRSGGTVSDNLFYFEPFSLESPADNSYTTNSLPNFSFNINKGRFSDLKDNLSKFGVLINKNNTGWKTYIDDIPVDFESVKNNSDNLQRTTLTTSGNGTYENKKIWVNYSNNNASIKVYAKSVDSNGNSTDKSFEDGGKKLTNGSYQWKVEAVDRQGHTQEAGTRYLRVGVSQVVSSQKFFPLTVLSITGVSSNLNLTTVRPESVLPNYSTRSSNPTFYGIAFANSKVTLELTDTACQNQKRTDCVKSYQSTTKSDSRFGLNVPTRQLQTGRTYTAKLSVSQGSDYNELSTFDLIIGSSNTPKEEVTQQTVKGTTTESIEPVEPTPTTAKESNQKETKQRKKQCFWFICW